MNQELRIKSFSKQTTFRFSRGFTLIELLIVVVIIGVLTTLLLANFIGIRQRARDTQRKADLKQIQSALELYRADQGTYPLPGSGNGNFQPTCGSGSSLLSPDGGATYMQKIPCDPLGGAYSYASDSNTYTLVSCLENLNDSQKDAVNNSLCNGTANWSFTLQNP